MKDETWGNYCKKCRISFSHAIQEMKLQIVVRKICRIPMQGRSMEKSGEIKNKQYNSLKIDDKSLKGVARLNF